MLHCRLLVISRVGRGLTRRGVMPRALRLGRNKGLATERLTRLGILTLLAVRGEYSSEYRSRTTNITLFPPPAMLDMLAVIEEIFTEFVDDNDQLFRQVKGPFYVLDRIQNALIARRSCCFLNRQTLTWR